MKNDEERVYYFPPIRDFEDTGYVTHGFSDGSVITARVVPSGDSGGFAIELVIKDGDKKEICNFIMDRFAALCLVDTLVKNLLNQEELIDLKLNNIKENKG